MIFFTLFIVINNDPKHEITCLFFSFNPWAGDVPNKYTCVSWPRAINDRAAIITQKMIVYISVTYKSIIYFYWIIYPLMYGIALLQIWYMITFKYLLYFVIFTKSIVVVHEILKEDLRSRSFYIVNINNVKYKPKITKGIIKIMFDKFVIPRGIKRKNKEKSHLYSRLKGVQGNTSGCFYRL